MVSLVLHYLQVMHNPYFFIAFNGLPVVRRRKASSLLQYGDCCVDVEACLGWDDWIVVW
jgi:hypothetical protein